MKILFTELEKVLNKLKGQEVEKNNNSEIEEIDNPGCVVRAQICVHDPQLYKCFNTDINEEPQFYLECSRCKTKTPKFNDILPAVQYWKKQIGSKGIYYERTETPELKIQ